MKYLAERINKNTALIELIPETQEDGNVLNMIATLDEAYFDALYYHYQKGLYQISMNASFVQVERWVELPISAIVKFE